MYNNKLLIQFVEGVVHVNSKMARSARCYLLNLWYVSLRVLKLLILMLQVWLGTGISEFIFRFLGTGRPGGSGGNLETF